MGLLQPDVGYRGRARGARLSNYGKAVTFHSLAHAILALKAASATERPVLLLSAPFAAGAAGPGWFDAVIAEARAEVPGAGFEAMLDCGDMAGYAMAALRQGVSHIRFEGEAFGKIVDIAGQSGATVTRARPESLDLYALELARADLEARCRDWLLDAV